MTLKALTQCEVTELFQLQISCLITVFSDSCNHRGCKAQVILSFSASILIDLTTPMHKKKK